MSKILMSLLLFSICMQGFHILEQPTAVKPYMLCVLLVLVWNVLNIKIKFRIFNVEKVALAFFLYLVVSSLWAEVIELSLLKTLGVAWLILTYFAIRSVLSTLSITTFFGILEVGGILLAIISLVYFALGLLNFEESMLFEVLDGMDRGLYGLYLEGRMLRMRGLFDSPNNQSIICVFLFLFYEIRNSRLATFGKLLFGLTLILTLSLSGFLALAAGYSIIILMRRRYSSLLRFAFGFLVVLTTIFIIVPEDIIDPLIDARLSRVSNGSGRWDVFEYTLKRISERPVLGYGLNQSREILKEHRELQSTHNSLLEAVLEGGIIALCLYILTWILFLAFAFKLSIRSKQPFYLASATSLCILSQSNLLTFNEITIFCYAIWIEFAVRSPASSLHKNESTNLLSD